MSATDGSSGENDRSDSARVLVVTTDPVTATMPGPAIRAWHLADILSRRHETVLGSTVGADRTHPAVEIADLSDHKRRGQFEDWADLLVVPAGVLHEWPQLEVTDKIAVVDLYDPYHLENLEPGGDAAGRAGRVSSMTDAISAHLRWGDFFLCATERQRDFWLGSLAAAGRINPHTYDADPTLSAFVSVVPFGLPADAPERTGPGLRDTIEGIRADDRLIVWAGGVYNWFDPVSLVRAMPGVSARVDGARLVFLGMKHPNPAIPAMRSAQEAREVSEQLGLTGRVVFFNEGWVPYDRRADYLLDADAGVSTHLDHIETRYSFRTRVLDYVWAGLPMVLTEGDILADLVRQAGVGRTVPSGDVPAIEEALVVTLQDGRPDPARFEPLRASLQWERVAQPLLDFCAAPRRAPDRAITARPAANGDGVYTPPVPNLRSRLRATRDRLVTPVATATAERMVQPVLAQTAELQRILGDQGDAADEVAETLGRTLTRLSAEITALSTAIAALTTEVAQLRDRMDRSEADS